jgi:O-antigen/teichoic acid export membrane protein
MTDSAGTAKPALTRRATLTFVNNMLQQGASVLTTFVVTPIVISGLGVPVYGAWVMIQQTIGYLAMGDLRPMSTLKFALGVRQHEVDDDEKRRLVGAAIRLWSFTVPVMLLIGAVLVFFTPSFIRAGSGAVTAVRIAMGVAVLHLALDRLLSVPQNVLVGANREYRGMGLNAISAVTAGVMMVLAIRAGFGIVGVASAAAISAILYSAARFYVMRNAVPWFGVARATRKEFVDFTKLSGWFSLTVLANLLLSSSDILLLGIMFGPGVAAVYGTTSAVLRVAVGPLGAILESGYAGIADLCGRRDWQRLARIRTEMHLTGIMVMGVVGTGVIVLNRSFLRLWVHRELFAGSVANVLIVVMMLFALIYRVDRIIAVSMMDFRSQALLIAVTASVALALGAGAALLVGPPAIIAAVVGAHVAAIFYLQKLTSDGTGGGVPVHIRPYLRPLAVTGVLYAAGVAIEPYVRPRGWVELIAAGAVLAAVAFAVIVTAGFDRAHRTILLTRLQQAMRSIGMRARQRRGSTL